VSEERKRRAGPKGPSSKARGTDPSVPRAQLHRRKRIVVASIGQPIPRPVIDRAIELARELQAEGEETPAMHVVSIAKIYGTKLGIPNPGLYPNKVEMEEQRDIVDTAARALERHGFSVTTRIMPSRHASKHIGLRASWIAASAVVIGDPYHAAPAWERVVKGDEARAVRKHTNVPVHLVPIAREDAKAHAEQMRSRAQAMRDRGERLR